MKTAFLVAFSPMTRVVVDVVNPEDLTEEEQVLISRTAREQMSESLGDYLNLETNDVMDVDTECPYNAATDEEK